MREFERKNSSGFTVPWRKMWPSMVTVCRPPKKGVQISASSSQKPTSVLNSKGVWNVLYLQDFRIQIHHLGQYSWRLNSFLDPCTRWIIWLTATNQSNLSSATLAELVQQQGMGLFSTHSQCIPGARNYLERCNTGCPPAAGKSQQRLPHSSCQGFGLWCPRVLSLFIAMQDRGIWRGGRKQMSLLWQKGTAGPCAIAPHYPFSKSFISYPCTELN